MARGNVYTRFLGDPDPSARRAELEAFLGPHPAPFLKMYDRLRETPARPGAGAVSGFVAMAFFLGPCWFFYRRMWIWAWGSIAVLVVFAFLPIPTGAGVGIAVAFAMLGRYACLQHAFGSITRLRGPAPVADLDVLRRAGGVSVLAGWISTAVYLVVLLIALAAGVLT